MASIVLYVVLMFLCVQNVFPHSPAEGADGVSLPIAYTSHAPIATQKAVPAPFFLLFFCPLRAFFRLPAFFGLPSASPCAIIRPEQV